jgi:hypothetical protein
MSPISLPEDPSTYYPPIYTWFFQVISFPQVSPPKSCIHLFSPPTFFMTLHFILYGLIIGIIFGEEY